MAENNEVQIKRKLECLIRNTEKKIINDLFVKYATKIVVDENFLNKKFKCERLTYQNYRHDFAGVCAYIHEISLVMAANNYVIRFSYCNNNDFTNDDEYRKEHSIFVNESCVYHDAESGGHYFEQIEEEETIIDANICSEDILDALKIFFDKVRLVF